VVICLQQGADLHMVQLMPLSLNVSCSSKIQIGFTLLVPAHPGSPGQRAVKRVCVCVCRLNRAYVVFKRLTHPLSKISGYATAYSRKHEFRRAYL